jgi:hypothetical protein
MVDFHPSDEDFTEFTQLLHTVWNQISSPDWWFEYLNSKKLTQIESIQE